MSITIRSPEIRRILSQAHDRGFTGAISITADSSIGRAYGTLKLAAGRLVSADFADRRGPAAVEAIADLEDAEISVARMRIAADPDLGLPDIASLVGASRSANPTVMAAPSGDRSGGFGIFPRVLLTMLLAALIPLGGLWTVNYLTIRQNVQDTVELNLQKTAQGLATEVDDWLDMNLRMRRQVASLDTIRSMDRAAILPILESMKANYEWSTSSLVFRPDGHMHVRHDGSETYLPDGTPDPAFYRGDRSYIQQVAAGRPIGEQLLISRASGKPAISLAVPIRGDDGGLIGIYSMGADLVAVSESVTDTRVGSSGYAILVDSAGRVIAHGGDADLVSEELQDISDYPALQAGYQDLTPFDLDGRRVVAYTAATGLDWTLIVQQDFEEAYADLAAASRNGLLLLLAALLVVAVFAYLLARRLVQPIQRLTAVADSISRGELDAGIDETRRGDEIGALARAIERLRSSVKVAFTELQRR